MQILEDEEDESDDDRSMSLSPLAQKPQKNATRSPSKSGVAPQPITEKRKFVADPPMLPSDTEDAELTETEGDDETGSIAPSGAMRSENGDDEQEEEEEDDDEYSEEGSDGEDESEEEIWEPPSAKTPRAKNQQPAAPAPADVAKAKAVPPKVTQIRAPQPKASTSALKGDPAKPRVVSQLAAVMQNLDMDEQDSDDSITILPKKTKGKIQASTEDGVIDGVESNNSPVVKKKKRYALAYF